MRMLRWTCLLPSYPRLVLRCRCRLVRSVVPEAREDELIRYRTINNQGVEVSRNLRDTIVTSRISWLRTQGIAISVSSGCRPVSFKYRSAATGDRSPTSFVANGLRWMRSIAGPKQHAQTFATYRSVGTRRKTGRGRTPVTEPPPRVGAGPTIHGNGRPPVVPDGPPRRYGGGVLQKRGVSERKGQRGGGGVMSWLPSAAKESRLRTAERGASGGRRPSSSFRVILPSTVREPSRSVRREVRMPASSKTIVRGWGAVLGLEDVRKACDARRRASFRGRLLSVVSVALVVSGLVVVYVQWF